MSWRDEQATVTQRIAIRTALDKHYGMTQGRQIYDEIDVDHMTKGEASDELKRLYALK